MPGVQWPGARPATSLAQPATARRLVPAAGSRARYAAVRCCTTRRDNAHGIEEREVLYQWHPWSGRAVRVHEVISKAGGDALRCSLATNEAGQWLEVPVWMFDRGTCLSVRLAPSPWVDCAVLLALKECLARASAGRLGDARSSNASDSGAEELLQPESGNHRCAASTVRHPAGKPPPDSSTSSACRRRCARRRG